MAKGRNTLSFKRPYKVYTALLTQQDTNAPVATVLENTLGGNVVWSYDAEGVYIGTLTGVFTEDKTATFITSTDYANIYEFIRNDNNSVYLSTASADTRVPLDNALSSTTIEIRVYN